MKKSTLRYVAVSIFLIIETGKSLDDNTQKCHTILDLDLGQVIIPTAHYSNSPLL
jgi:hypothetical protein